MKEILICAVIASGVIVALQIVMVAWWFFPEITFFAFVFAITTGIIHGIRNDD